MSVGTDILEDVEIDGSFAFTNVEEVNDLNCAGLMQLDEVQIDHQENVDILLIH